MNPKGTKKGYITLARRIYGEGGVDRLASGRWRVRVSVTRPDGTHARISEVHETAREARAALSRLRQLKAAGATGLDRHRPLSDWLDHWVETIAAATIEESTLRSYRSPIRTQIKRHPIGHTPLGKLSPERIEDHYRRLRDSGYSAATIRRLHSILSNALDTAVDRGILTNNPAGKVKPGRVQTREAEVFTVEQARHAVSVALDSEDGLRWAFALTFGLRQSERLAVTWDRIDLEKGTLTIDRALTRLNWRHGCSEPCGMSKPYLCPDRHGGGLDLKTTKSKSGVRTWVIPRPLIPAIEAHRERQLRIRGEEGHRWVGFVPASARPGAKPLELVFCIRTGRPLDPERDGADWKRFLNEAGLPQIRGHEARHTAATVLLSLRVPPRVVMELMGWSDAAMLRRYQHVLDSARAETASALEGVLFSETVDESAPARSASHSLAGVTNLAQFREGRKKDWSRIGHDRRRSD